MGRKGREIVEINLNTVIERLKSAMALEWYAAYYYWYCSQVAEGLESRPIADYFKGQVSEEMGHAEEISERIQQLGGEILRSPAEWAKYGKSVEPVKDHSDLVGMIRKALEVEAEAIVAYNDLQKMTRNNDVLTHELAEELLKAEVDEEEDLENLLGPLLQKRKK